MQAPTPLFFEKFLTYLTHTRMCKIGLTICCKPFVLNFVNSKIFTF